MRPALWWRPADLGGPLRAPEVDRASYAKFDVPLPRSVKLYVLVQFAAMLVATTVYLQRSDGLSPAARLAGAVAVIWTLFSLGGLLDRRHWAVAAEAARLVGLGLGVAAVLALAPATAVAALAAASGIWLFHAGRKGLPLPAEVR